MRTSIIIFIKNPILGKVKTRLAASIGNDKALLVYQKLLMHTKSIVENIPGTKYIYYSNMIDENDIWDTEKFKKRIQKGSDLGIRIQNAFSNAFDDGKESVLLIGSDCIELTELILIDAIHQVQYYDVVLGPAKDGGYYLLAIKKMYAALFKKIEWSTEKVLGQTIAICKRLNLSIFLLPTLSDIDTETDLENSQICV